MKPIIGICANFSTKDEIGKITQLGGPLQQWQLIADDYIKAIKKSGGVPIIIPVFENHFDLCSIVSKLDGIVFTGGDDIDPFYYNEEFNRSMGMISPKRDKHEIKLIKYVINKTDIPILGICRGHQLINIANGGSLYKDMKSEGLADHFFISSPMDHPTHSIDIKNGTLLNSITKKETIRVNSYHHQSIKDLGEGLVISAKHNNIIEAIEGAGERFILGLQWHPETLIDICEKNYDIFKNFVKECGGK